MRILVLSRDLPPAVSGIGDHTEFLAAELARRSHDVHVVARAPADAHDTFSVHAVETWDGRRGWSDAVSRALDEIAPDVILWQYNPFSIGTHGIALHAGALARALRRRARLVVLFHELWFPWGRGGARGLAWAIAQRLETRRVARAADATIVTTEDRRRALPGSTRIPVGPNVPPLGIGKAEARAALGIDPGAFVVAHFGGGHGHDMEVARAAIASLRNHGVDPGLLLIGNARGEARWRTGRADRAMLSRALAAADVYVHPDAAGPAPGRRGALVAALAHGLPVVAFHGPQAAPQLRDGVNVVLVPPHEAPLARALERLAKTPAERAEIGAKARETYEEEFSWGRIGDAIVRVCADR